MIFTLLNLNDHSSRRLISQNYYLNKSAKDGYRSYLQAYASHSLRTIFDVHKLDLVKVAKSFGFCGSAEGRSDIGCEHESGLRRPTVGGRMEVSRSRVEVSRRGAAIERILLYDALCI